MLVASWRRALRTRMGRLRFAETDGSIAVDEGLDALFGVFECFAHAMPRGAADDVVAVKCGFESDSGEEIGVEFRPELAEFFQRKIAEFAVFFETVTDGVT